MRKYFMLPLILMIISLVSNSQASKQTYEVANLKRLLSEHKIVAILPFNVTIAYKHLPKGFDAEGNKREEAKEGINMQEGLYTFLLRKSKSYTVTFQDAETTNILLKKSGLFDKLDITLKDSICKVLNVDGIIGCSYEYEKTGSEAGAIASTLLLGFGGSVATGTLTMHLYNGKDGTLLWRFAKEMKEGAFTSANDMMERMMRKVSRNFPYEK